VLLLLLHHGLLLQFMGSRRAACAGDMLLRCCLHCAATMPASLLVAATAQVLPAAVVEHADAAVHVRASVVQGTHW
jgi:hypothetical protein